MHIYHAREHILCVAIKPTLDADHLNHLMRPSTEQIDFMIMQQADKFPFPVDKPLGFIRYTIHNIFIDGP